MTRRRRSDGTTGFFPTLESCPDIKRSGHRFEEVVCTARYPNATVRVQGVFMESALDSDTVPYQINEEVHLWKPGFLSKARRRQTRVWNAKAFDISNAGNVGDQLYSSYEDGTCEKWEVLCPKCKAYHEMRFRFDPNKTQLGGLRWDSSGCKMDNGRFDYNRLEKTIRYEFPCGHIVRDLASERRTLSGKYSDPTNQGAHLSHRSWNFEAVSCDAIKWLSLIQEWHASIRALRIGDSEPMRRFVTERECRFYDENKIPFSGKIVLTSGARLTRTGLPGEICKAWGADWQEGYKSLGQLTHYWLVIESILQNCSSQVIFAGQVSDETELLMTLKEHGITGEDSGGLFDGFIDASKNQKHILSFCYRAGINAVVGGSHGKGGYRHGDGSWRFYSEKKFIYTQLGITFDTALRDHPDWFSPTRGGAWVENENCPFIREYDKGGILKNSFFIREMKSNVLKNNPKAGPEDYIERMVPEDIGEDYLSHMQAWERDPNAARAKKMGLIEGFKPMSKNNHCHSCTEMIDLFKESSGLLGLRLAQLGVDTSRKNKESKSQK